MAFRLHICGDVGGEKRNVEVTFDSKPETVAKVAEESEVLFRTEMSKRGLNARDFNVEFVVFYEETTRRWRPLEQMHQLQDLAQLYVFQTGNPDEKVRDIPPPSLQVNAYGGASRTVHRPGQSTLDMDKTAYVFKALDINQTDALEFGEVLVGFQMSGIELNDDAVRRLFEKSDADRDAILTWQEFQVFANLFPNTIETLFSRLRDIEQNPEAHPAAVDLRRQRSEENRIRRELEEATRQRELLETTTRQERAVARERDPRRRFLEEEEQDLINKEFALQYQRDQVVQAEMMFGETAVRFDRAAMRQGSPRRARYLS